MNSIRYLSQHNPHPGTPNDADNRRLCWQARHAETEGERLAARNELVMQNQGLIAPQALRVRKTSPMPLDDLISEGQIGLIMAIRLFDFDRGIAFSTYATICIRRYIQRQSWIHGSPIVLPCHLFATKKRSHLQADADRARCVGSLETPTGKRSRLMDEIPDRDMPRTEDDVQADLNLIDRLMERITDRERRIVTLCFGIGTGDGGSRNADVARQEGVTGEAVRQVKSKAIGKMAEALRKERIA